MNTCDFDNKSLVR